MFFYANALNLHQFNMKEAKPGVVVVAEDDEDDRLMTEEAFRENGMETKIIFVQDGVELLDYLHRRGKFTDPSSSPRPALVLLDLNMPRMDGREALKQIKSDDQLRTIPINIFTTSKAQEDVVRSYGLGVNCFISKPVTFTGLVDAVRQISHFWFDLAEIPK